MAVRTKQLWAPAVAATGASSVVYTVPSGETAILKSVTMVNPHSSTTGALKMWVGAEADANLILWKPIGAQGDVASTYNMFWVLMAGQTVRVRAVAVPITVMGGGTELEGVAD